MIVYQTILVTDYVKITLTIVIIINKVNLQMIFLDSILFELNNFYTVPNYLSTNI